MENEEITTEMEEITEENTEQSTTNEAILEQLEILNEHLENMENSEELTEEETEELTEELTEESTEIVYTDPTIDHTLYFSTQVENADINDVYAMQLSIRNILLITVLLALAFLSFRMVRGLVDRVLNR